MPRQNAVIRRLERISFEENSQYQIHAPLEIANLLRSVSKKRLWVSLYSSKGDYSLLTMILFVDVNTGEIILDASTNPAENQQFLADEQVVVVGEIDGVHLQFAAPRAELMHYQGIAAFKLRLPNMMLKLQRREYYRALAPADSRPKGSLQLSDNHVINFEIIDISVGGINIIYYSGHASLKENTVYQDCRVSLPGVGMISAAIEVKHIYETVLPSGASAMRAGCQFHLLPVNNQTTIQRYILDLERARRAQAWD